MIRLRSYKLVVRFWSILGLFLRGMLLPVHIKFGGKDFLFLSLSKACHNECRIFTTFNTFRHNMKVIGMILAAPTGWRGCRSHQRREWSWCWCGRAYRKQYQARSISEKSVHLLRTVTVSSCHIATTARRQLYRQVLLTLLPEKW